MAYIRAQWYFRNAEYLGKRVRVWGKIIVANYGRLIIHDQVRISSIVAPVEIAVWEKGCLEINEKTFINYGCSISALSSVIIGKNCRIGTFVNITDNNFHSIQPEIRDVIPDSEPVVIEDNVWLGTRAIVLPGVKIEAGSVIGAGSVVTKNIPARVIAAGIPARVIREIPLS